MAGFTPRVFVSGITPEGEQILKQYLAKFMSDAKIEPIKPSAARVKVNQNLNKPDVVLIILEESIYTKVSSVVELDSANKVHKYLNDEGLINFLTSKFGKLEGISVSNLPLEDTIVRRPEPTIVETEIIKEPVSANIPTPEVEVIPTQSVFGVSDADVAEIERLRSRLSKSEMTIRSLTAQLEEKSSGVSVEPLVEKIRILTEEISEKDKEITLLRQSGGGDSARNNQEILNLKQELRNSRSNYAELEYEKNKLQNQIGVSESRISELNNQIVEISEQKSALEHDVEHYTCQIEELNAQIETLKDSNKDYINKTAGMAVLKERADKLVVISAELDQTKSALEDKELELSNLGVDLERTTKDLDTTKTKLNEVNSLLETRTDENNKLTLELNSLKNNISQKDSSIFKLQEELTKKNDDYDKLQQTINITATINIDLEAKNKNLVEENTKLEETNETLVKEKDDLTIKITELENKFNSANTQNSDLIVKFTDMRKQNTELINNNNVLKSLNQDLTIEKNDLSKKLETSKSKNTTLENDNNNLQSKTELLLDQNNKLLEENEKLKESKERLDSQKSELSKEIGSLRGDLAIKDAKIKQLELSSSNASDELISVRANIERLGNVEAELETKTQELKHKAEEIELLNTTISQQKSEIDNKTDEINSKNSLLNEKENALMLLNNVISDKDDEIETLTQKISYSEEKVKSLMTEIAEKESSLPVIDTDEITELKDKINSKETEINLLNSRLEDKDETITKLKNDVIELSSTNTTLEEEINELRVNESTLDNKNRAYDLLLTEKERLENQVKDLEQSKEELQEKLNKQETGVSDNTELVEKISHLETENTKLQNTIERLETSNSKLVEQTDNVYALEEELDNARQNIANLESEITTLRENDKSNEVDVLNIRLEKANNEIKVLKETKASGVDNEEYNRLRAEFDAKVQEFNELQLTYSDEKAYLEDIENSIFTQFADIALPRLGMNVEVEVPNKPFPQFFCVASGSIESNASVYSVIRRTFERDNQRTFLIVDLETETNIDSEVGMRTAKSPISWLNGSDSIQNYVYDTKYKNVKGVSVSFAYINDLCLLNVDWNRKLQELQNVANVVIFNVGCLNNIVSKVLLRSFGKCMRGYIITKATPVNLRSLSNNLSGLVELSRNIEVVCHGFDSGNSRQIFDFIAEKHKPKFNILNDTNAIPFK